MQIILLKWKKILPAFILMLAISIPGGRAEARNKFEIFPIYPSIQPNVNFWLKIYTRYSSDQGVIHDKYRMNRIYGVIPLDDPYRGNGRKINNKRIKAAKKEYKAILKIDAGQTADRSDREAGGAAVCPGCQTRRF